MAPFLNKTKERKKNIKNDRFSVTLMGFIPQSGRQCSCSVYMNALVLVHLLMCYLNGKRSIKTVYQRKSEVQLFSKND